VLLLLLSLVAQGSFNPEPFLMPDTSGETLLLYALTSLNFLAFVTVLFILMRHALKLAQERRAERPGSRFKTRMVGYAIGLSLLPALLLFFFAFGLLNRSIDRWFGEPARKINDDAKTLEESYFSKEEAELASVGRAITHSLNLASRGDYDSASLKEQMGEEIREHNLMLARLVIAGKRVNFGGINDQARPVVKAALREAEQLAVESLEPFTSRYESQEPRAIYFVAASRISDAPGDGRLLIVAREFPPELTRLSSSIDEQHRSFHNMAGKIKRIKTIYVLLLGAVTLLLIFTANWLALYVARGVTVPIQALAEATDRVARGDFTRPVEVVAEDELATLVSSFNQMSGQISENRERLERAAEDLRRSNQALDNRRRYIETVLESLSTGVISADENTRMATINRAALSMLGLEERPEIGTPIDKIVDEQGSSLAALCRRARRSEISQSEIEFKRQDGSTLQTATTAIALRNSEGNIDGFVVVIEDLTDLIQAERAAAWSEVARRMAHEIKNPLTPIQLSAERIMRNYNREMMTNDSSRFDKVVTEGTSTIVREVAALQRMVEEFSRFARLPEARPVDASLNEVISDAVALYTERLDGVQIDCKLADDLPVFRLDPEQIKRVLINLIDNAVESLGAKGTNGNGLNRNSGVLQKKITIETRFLKESETVRLVISDTGHGIRPADRGKLFLPKFSTRDRGTGLGLAIVSHIVADHKGRIWVEDNRPRGARFVIELPTSR
jgi:PAS domain S-box-containing protein